MPVRTVLYVIRTWALGGGHTILMSLMKRLPRDRFRILCVVYETPSGMDELLVRALQKEGLSVLDERIPWHSRFDARRARHAVRALVEKHRVDLVHTHDDQSNVLIGLGRDEMPCACVASAYGWWRRWLPLRSHAYVFLEKRIALPRFELVITVSEDMRRRALQGRTPEDRVRVVYTGVDEAALRAGASREETRARLGIPADALVAGTVGRVYVEKGHRFLFDAVHGLIDAWPSLRLLVVGSGPLLDELRRRAARCGLKDRVLFTGYYEDLPGALRAMDVFVQPSILDEGLPTSILEAQALGVPVIASNVGGVSESLEEGRTGLLVPRRDVRALRGALAALLADPERRRAMGEAGRALAARKFRIDRMIAEVAAIYEEALEAWGNAP